MSTDFPLEDHQLELENRIRNLMWTVSGDYSLEIKPDVEAFLRSPNIALYDGIKQGGLARFFDREALSLYLVKKVYCQAMEGPLLQVASLCMEEAVGTRLDQEREGIHYLRRRVYEEILDKNFRELSSSPLGIWRQLFCGRSWMGNTREPPRSKPGWIRFIPCARRQIPWM